MKRFVLSFVSLLLFAAAMFVSCEIGLGESVDTQPPLVAVEAPSADYIVKGAFIMSGTCSDEQGVASIAVTLKNTSTKASYSGYSGTIQAAKGKWTCSIDPLSTKKPIPDGTYEASVKATDFAGRTTTATKSFVIDNTAPLLVLTRPSTKVSAESEEKFDSYGAQFDITGQVADDNNIDRLVVSVYSDKECQNKIRDVELNNVPPTIDLTVAKAGDGIYEAIYGNEKAGTKEFYCTITIYDEARHCPAIENDAGNSRTVYYLYNDIYSDLLKTYKITEIYHMLNGSYTGSASRALSTEETIAQVKEILAKAENQSQVGSFSLNPENSPVYTLSGYDAVSGSTETEKHNAIAEADSDYGLLNGSSVTIKFSAGLDKSPLSEKSLGFYLMPYEKTGDGTEWKINEDKKVWLIRPYKSSLNADGKRVFSNEFDYDYDSEYAGTGKTAAEVKAYFAEKRNNITTVGSYDFTATLTITPDTLAPLATGTCYAVGAVGFDENENPFVNANKYGFILQSSGSAPVLSVTHIAPTTEKPATANAKSSWYVKKGGAMSLWGTVTAEDTCTIKVTVTDSSNVNHFTTETISVQSTENPAGEVWGPLSIPNKYFTTTKDGGVVVSANYTVTVSAISGTRTVEKQIAVGYDVDGPQIEIASVLPQTEALVGGVKRADNVNGVFSIKARVSDEFYKLSETEKISLDVVKGFGTGSEETLYSYSTSSANFTHEINSSVDLAGNDNVELALVITAYDFAGNKSTVSQNIYLNQATDLPVVELTNAKKEGYESSYPVDGTSNVFLSGAPITATISDDDGIESIKINVYTTPYTSGDSPKYTQTINKSKIASNPYPLTYTVPTALATYVAEIIVTDTENASKNLPCKFYFMVDSGAPSIVVNTGSSGRYYGKKSGPIEVSGTVTGLGGLTIYNNYNEADPSTGKISGTQPEIAATTASWKDSFKVPSTVTETGSATTNTYTVRDKKGRTGTAVLTYYVDNTAPSASILNDAALVESSDLKLFGTAEDAAGTVNSGVNAVYYQLLAANATAPAVKDTEAQAEAAGWIKLSGTATWNFWQTFVAKGGDTSSGALEEGKYTLYVCAYDIAQNVTATAAKYTFSVDLNKPVIATSYYIDSNPAEVKEIGSSSQAIMDKPYTFLYSVSDTFGLHKTTPVTVEIKKDGKTVSSSGYTNTYSAGSGKITFTTQADGTYEYVITAKDENNKTSSVTRTVILDTEAPEIEITLPTSDDEWSTNNSVTVKGTADDTSGVDAVYYSTDASPSVPSTNTKTASSWTGSGWKKCNGTISWNTKLTGLSAGTTTVSIAAVDIYGNVSPIETRKVNYDGEAPKLTSVKYSVDDGAAVSVSSGDSVTLASKKIVLSGNATDNYNLKSVTVSGSKDSGDAAELYKYTVASDTTEKTKAWSTGDLSAKLADGKWKLTVTVEDASGQSASENYTFLIDTQAPSVSAGKIFDAAVSATYKTTEKGNVSVTVTDPGVSGIEDVQYLVDSDVLNESALKAKEFTGTLTKSDTTYSKQVTFSQGKNYVYVKAVDGAGNTTYYGAGGAFYCNVDSEKPVAAFVTPVSGSTITDKEDLAVKINVSDATSKFTSTTKATIKLFYPTDSGWNTTAAATKQIATGTDGGDLTVTFEKALLTKSSMKFTVEVTDAAGLTNEKTYSTVTLDNVAPTLKVNNPVESASVTALNGKIKLNGTSYDSVEVDYVKLYRTKVSGDGSENNLTLAAADLKAEDASYAGTYVLMQEYSGSDKYNWSFADFDTTAFADGTAIKFYVVSADKAGNKAYVVRSTKVDQDADRPVITFSNVTLNSGMSASSRILHQQDTVYGTVTDDDGVKDVEISVNGGSTWTSVYSNGAWEYKLPESDGLQTVLFKVTDVEDSVFISGLANELETPKLSDKTTTLTASAKSSLYLVVDRSKPEVVSTKWTDSAANETVLNANSSFITNGSSFTLSGSVKDGYLVSSIKLTGKNNGGSAVTLLEKTGIDSSSADWSQKFVTGTATAGSGEKKIDDGSWELILTVTDKAGKESDSVKYTAVIDTVAPVISTHTLSSAVGSVSSDGVWHESAAPELKVSATDATSGIKGVYYLVSNASMTLDELKSQTVDSPTTKNGSLYTKSLSLSEGKNYVYIKVIDEAENAAYYGNGGLMTWNVDVTGPKIQINSPSGADYLNKNNAYAFDILVSDALNNLVSSTPAVLGNVKTSVKIYSSDKSKSVTLTPSVAVDAEDNAKLRITGTIPTTTWTTITSDTVIFAVSVCDDVKNETVNDALSLAFDNTPPTVEIKNPAGKLNASGQLPVNGIISITGVAGDNKGLSSVKLYRTAKASETASATTISGTYAGNYVLLKEYSGTDAYNWTLEDCDTTTYSDGSVVTLYAVAEDTAQNKSETVKVLLIDQDADRPEIKITNASLAGMTSSSAVWHKQSTIYGTVSDDDGVSSLKIATAAEFAEIKAGTKTWAAIAECYDSGEWKYTFADEGDNTLYFYVKDTSGTSGREFVSNLGDNTTGNKLLDSPKIYDGSKNTFGYKDSTSKDTGIYLKVSTKVPSIDEIYFRTDDNSASADWGTSNPASNGWLSSAGIAAKTFGGPGSKLYVMVKASDANGIASTGATLAEVAGTPKYVSANKTIGVFELDTSSAALDGNQKLVLTATGASTNEYSRDFTITIDNTAPVIKFSSHSSGMTVFGSQENTVMGTATEAVELYYQVTKTSTAPSVTGAGWTNITEYVSPISWLLAFDDKTGSNSKGGNTYHDGKQLNAYLASFGYDIASDDAEAQNVYIWLYAKDELKNVSVATPLRLVVNPKGDKPTVKITAPADGEKVGGSIRIGGETSIVTNQVDKVWIQILPDYTDGKSWNNWESEFNTLLTTSGKTVVYSVESIKYGAVEKGRGIVVGGSPSNWYITLNNSDELNGDGSKEITYGIRAYALSSSGKVSEPYVSKFTLDPNSPVISDLALVQYDGLGNVVRTLAYEAGMWISGDWTLTGSIADDSGIKLVTVDGKETSDIENNGSAKTSGYYNKKLKLPVKGEGDFGVIDFQIVAYEGKDENPLTGKAQININYDNKAPEFSIDLADSSSIVQSDGTYKLSGTLIEESTADANQSGFGQVAFYFTRTVGGNTYYIDPMVQSGAARKSNRIDVSTLTNADGLYYKTGTISSVNSKEITLSAAPDSTYVRAGGLCKIMDSFYIIKGIAGKVITLNSVIDDSAAGKTVYFAMAQVADNTVTENGTTTYYGGGSAITNDDGDQMVESVSVTGYTAKWNAYLNSINIPDGTVDVHFVGFDKAGNHAFASASNCEVVNNRPRLAGVVFASDINGSDTLEESEYIRGFSGLYNAASANKKTGVTVNGRKANGEGVYSLEIPEGLGEAVLTIKGLTEIVPEVVGGNEGLGYSYSLNGKNIAYTELNSKHGNGESNTIRDGADTKITLTLKDLINAAIPDGTGKTLDIKIWDKTEGKTAGTDSQWANVKIQVNVAIQDKTSPSISISPFFWNSATDNSLYKNSKNNGHIELPDDWKTTSAYVATAGEFDADPKVSGKVVFRGVATDNSQLKELSLKIPGFNSNNAFVIAKYDAANQKWTDCTNATVTAAGVWTANANAEAANVEANLTANNWASKITKSEFTVSGHNAEFEVYWNSAAITNVAATEVKVVASATDRGTAKIESDEVTYTSNAAGNSSDFKIDVVPYISAIKTTINSLLGKDYVRSSSGAYTVKIQSNGNKYDSITVDGFNLKPTEISGTTSDVRISSKQIALNGTTKIGTGLSATSNADASWNVTMKTAGNGYLTILTNGIPSLNNVDSDADYNKEDSLLQVELNNDRKIDIWDLNPLRTTVTNANNATYPSMVMNENTPQFAYVNNAGGYGLAEFYDGSRETKIYENWDLFTYTSVALNSDGKRAALYDINVVQGGTGYASDAGGIMTNFFYNPPNTTWNSTTYYFRDYNVWMDGLYKNGVTAVLNRYQYPTIRLVGNDKLSHTFYATYDSLDDRVIFRYYTVGTDKNMVKNATKLTDQNTNVLYINKTQMDQTTYNRASQWPTYTDSANNNTRFNNSGNYPGYTIQPQAFEAGNSVGLYTATTGIPVTVDASGNITAARAVLLYYSSNKLYYRYAKNDDNTSWSDAVELDENCEASYISVVADKDNHVHIAYQDSIAGDVKYVYIPTYDNPETRKLVKVDTYLTVGEKLTLDVHGNTPYIAYKGLGNTAKVAWYAANSGVPSVDTLVDSVNEDEKYTGAWECQTVPYRIVDSDSNRFNVGVGKTDGRAVIGYSNNQSGAKGIEYFTRLVDLSE